MNSIITAIDEQLQAIDVLANDLAEERIRLEQAKALVLNSGPITQPEPASTDKRGYTMTHPKWKKGNKKQKVAKKSLPWVPSSLSKPPTQAMYDLFEDGTAYTFREICDHIAVTSPSSSEQQIRDRLTQMKVGGRVHATTDGKWRRKHARHPENKPAPVALYDSSVISTEKLEGMDRSEVVEQLEKLAGEGQLVKETRGDQVVYVRPGVVIGNAKGA